MARHDGNSDPVDPRVAARASPGGLDKPAPELPVAWALSSPARERLDVSVRYRKLNTLTVGEFRIE